MRQESAYPSLLHPKAFHNGRFHENCLQEIDKIGTIVDSMFKIVQYVWLDSTSGYKAASIRNIVLS